MLNDGSHRGHPRIDRDGIAYKIRPESGRLRLLYTYSNDPKDFIKLKDHLTLVNGELVK